MHGNPSGIDVETSLQGGMLLFSRNAGSKPIPLNRVVHFLVVYSGKPRRTSTLIDKVELKRKQFPNFFDCLTRSASFLSLEVVDALTAGDLPRLGALMCISQATLSWIGVSTSSIDRLIEDISAQEVFGAKLTGAGGGGSIIALPKPEAVDKISKYMPRNYAYSFVTQVPTRRIAVGVVSSELTVVKLGGSLITDKDRPLALNLQGINSSAKSIARAFGSNKIGRLFLIHGGGSFGHYCATKYHLSTTRRQVRAEGVARIASSMITLHSFVPDRLVKEGVPCKTVMTSELLTKDGKEYQRMVKEH